MKLIFFDLDGTLLPGTTASLEIARATGTTAQLLDLERSHPFVVGPPLNILRPDGTAALREKASASYEGQDLLESFHTMLLMMGLR